VTWSAPVSPTDGDTLGWSSALPINDTIYFLGGAGHPGYPGFWTYTSGARTTSRVAALDSNITLGSSSSTISRDGDILISAYTAGSTVYERYSSDYGRSWGPRQTVSKAETVASSITSTLDGPFGVIWTSGNSNYTVRFSKAIATSVRLQPLRSSLGAKVKANASLGDVLGNPLSGSELNFSVGTTALTNSSSGSGVGYFTFVAPSLAKTYNVTVAFGGSADYFPSTSSSILVVVPWWLRITTGSSNLPLFAFGGRVYYTGADGTLSVPVNMTGSYQLDFQSPLLTANGVRIVFVAWSDGVQGASRSIDIDSNVTLSAATKVQYFLSLSSSYGETSGGGWHDANSNVQIGALSPVDQGNGTRRVFIGWLSSSGVVAPEATSVLLDAPANLTALWKTQYYLNASTPFGAASGSGWYDKGSVVEVALNKTAISENLLVTNVFERWSGDASGASSVASVTMTAPRTAVAVWGPDYTVVYLVAAVVAAVIGSAVLLSQRRSKLRR
jgi:hypothetical protein